MRSSAGNSTVVLRYKTANSSLTISEKEEIMNKRIGPVQVLQESVSENPPDRKTVILNFLIQRNVITL